MKYEDARKKKGIYVVAKPVSATHVLKKIEDCINIGNSIVNPINIIPNYLISNNDTAKYEGSYHTYLAYVDENGNEKIIRGGPEDNDMIKDVPNAPRLETQSNIPLEESYDKIEKGTEPETRFATRLDIPDDQLDEAWNTAVQVSKLIDDGQIKYLNNPLGEDVNSNSTIRTIVETLGYDPNEYLPEETRNHVPGYENNLFNQKETKQKDIEKQLKEKAEKLKGLEASQGKGNLSQAIDMVIPENLKTAKSLADTVADIKETAQREKLKSEINDGNRKLGKITTTQNLLSQAKESLIGLEAAERERRDAEKELAGKKETDEVLGDYYRTLDKAPYIPAPTAFPAGGFIPKLMPHPDTKKEAEQAQKVLDAAKGKENASRREVSQKMLELIKKNNNPLEDITLKRSEDLTEEEVKEANKYTFRPDRDADLTSRLNDSITKYYQTIYSNEPVKQDATGRNIEPLPKIEIRKEAVPLKTKDGMSLEEAFQKTADTVAAHPEGVKLLQKSINQLGYVPALKEDNDLGAKTVSGLKSTLVKQGSETLDNYLQNSLKEAFKEVKEPEAANNDEDETTDALAGSPRGRKLAVV